MIDGKDRTHPGTGMGARRSSGNGIGAGESLAWRLLEAGMTIKPGGAAYTMSEFSAPQGAGSPRHVHHGDDEALFLLQGSIRVGCGDDQSDIGPGSLVFLPRAVPHTFVVTSQQPALGLQLTGLTGFGTFIAEVTRRAGTCGPALLPSPARALPPGNDPREDVAG